MEKELHEVKYVRELMEFFDAYGQALIDEIYVGTGIALGLSEKQAYEMISKRPGTLEKAGFFRTALERFKGIFRKKPDQFRPKKKLKPLKGNPLTPEEWDIFNSHIDKYWKNEADKITGDMTAKAFLLGRETTKFRETKKPYQNKSLYQVVTDQFGGKMPDAIDKAYRTFDFTNAEKKALNRSLSDVAMYVTQSNNEIKEAIRHVVNNGIDEGKSYTEIASDLYWNVQEDEEMNKKYTAETLRRNWSRVALTEMASVYEAGILAPLEAEAMESMDDPSKAVYMVRTGGTCDWCKSVQGTVVRLIPKELSGGIDGEDLSSLGIKDANTNVAIWSGKNNVGRKQKDWLIACPAHPHNVATFTPIDLENEFFNKKSGRVEKRKEKDTLIPDIKQVERPEDFRKPKKIGSGMVQVGNNVYEAVAAHDFNRKLKEWQENRDRPIPVNRNSTQYIRIFEGAE
jgi:hypothetical protein